MGRKVFDATLGEALAPPHRSLGHFIRLAAYRDEQALIERYGAPRHAYPANERLRGKTAMAESSGATGGYTVPQDLARPALAPLGEASVFRSNGAMQVFGLSRSQEIPYPDVTTARAAGTPPWAGGLSFAWGKEGALRTRVGTGLEADAAGQKRTDRLHHHRPSPVRRLPRPSSRSSPP